MATPIFEKKPSGELSLPMLPISNSTPNLHQLLPPPSLDEKPCSRIATIGVKSGSNLKDFAYYQAQFQSENVKQLLKELKGTFKTNTTDRLKKQ